MRLDHIAYRVKNKDLTAKFFMDAFGYRLQGKPFTIDFGDNQTAQCLVLEPLEKLTIAPAPWTYHIENVDAEINAEYHLPPEIFISDGSPGSIVGDWVAARDNIGGIHHMAYQVDNVEETMKKWLEKGYAMFSTTEPIKCPGLTQVFTTVHSLTGVTIELIERGVHGFCKDSVKSLMIASQEKTK